MNNDRGKLYSPFVSPDSIRAYLQFMKKYFDGYTKRDVGYTDIHGCQYSGTVENFGSEIYTEARKLRLDKYPIESVIEKDNMKFYFDILYSELIETYDQQNMLVAVLKENTLLSSNTYRIIFNNCRTKYVLRSESWSDPDVYRDEFIVTDDPPILEITDENGNVTQIILDVIPFNNHSVEYCFHVNRSSRSLLDGYETGDTTATTRNITNRDKNIPMIWLHVDSFNTLPDIGFIGNEDESSNPLLTTGTDGHAKSFLYPLIYGEPDFPISGEKKWFIKAIASKYDTFIMPDINKHNYASKVDYIEFWYADNPWDQPEQVSVIDYSEEYTRFLLSEDVDWEFHRPTSSDYDYDGTTYKNPIYAYIELNEFIQNMEINGILKSAFRVIFDRKFLSDFEEALLNGVSGIHMDVGSNYSENGIMERNGVTYALSEFDGLPTYLHTLEDKTFHSSHLDIYSIRDMLNNDNQKITDKQTSGIILDSALTQKDIHDMSLNMTMKYNYDVRNEYHTIAESISEKNWLTSIVYVDENTFADSDMPEYKDLPKFIYHGNGTFSCDIIEMDPELEFARGYLITNDPAEYDNNGSTEFKKSDRTLARMCDIPTTFSQLQHQTGVAPTIIIDKDYVRMEAPYTDEDAERLWNTLSSRWVTIEHDECNIGVFNNCDLDTVLDSALTPAYDYTIKENMNSSIMYNDCDVEVGNGGSGYSIGDKFVFYIGGLLVTGRVSSINSLQNSVASFTLDIPLSYEINIANLKGRITTFETETTVGSGIGLTIQFTVDPVIWNNAQFRKTEFVYSNLFTTMLDENGFLWLWEFDDDVYHSWVKRSQLTGPDEIENVYDNIDRDRRPTGDVMIYNVMNIGKNINRDVSTTRAWSTIKSDSQISKTIPLELVETFDNYCNQNGYYTLFDPGEYASTYMVSLNTRTGQLDTSYPDRIYNAYKLPRFNDVNLRQYIPYGSALQRIMDDDIQPKLCFYNPIKEYESELTALSSNVFIEDKKPILWIDRVGTECIDNYCVLTMPLFEYNEYTKNQSYIDVENSINTMNDEELINYIHNNYPDSYVLDLVNSSTPMNADEMRDYILSNYLTTPAYKRNPITKKRDIGEQVAEKIKGNYCPVGEQPKGDFSLLADLYSNKVILSDQLVQLNTDIMYIFRIEYRMDLKDLRVFNDDYNQDISNNVLLVMNNHLYIFNRDQENPDWIRL